MSVMCVSCSSASDRQPSQTIRGNRRGRTDRFRSINDDGDGSKSSITGGAKGYHKCLALQEDFKAFKKIVHLYAQIS